MGRGRAIIMKNCFRFIKENTKICGADKEMVMIMDEGLKYGR